MGTSKIKFARDGAKFFLILLKIITIFSPLRVFVPVSAVTFATGSLYAALDHLDAVARHQLVGAAHHAGGSDFSGRTGLRTNLGAAVREPAVIRRAGRAIWLAVLAGLVLRLAFGFGYWVGKPLTHDEREYLSLAANLVEGRASAIPLRRRASRSLNGSARASLSTLPGRGHRGRTGLDALTAVRLAQSVRRRARRLACRTGGHARGRSTGRPQRGLDDRASIRRLSGLRHTSSRRRCIWPLAVGHVLVAIGRSWRVGRAGRAGWLLWCGVVGGLAALTRPAHLFFLLLLGLWLLAKRRLRDAVLLTAGALLVIAPWTVRNVTRVWTRGADRVGRRHHVLDRQPPVSTGEGDLAANPAIKRDNQRLRAAPRGAEPRRARACVLSRGDAGHRTRSGVVDEPAGPQGVLHMGPAGAVIYSSFDALCRGVAASYGLLLAGGIVGAVAVIRARRWPVALGLLLASAVLVCVVFFPQERFRIPVIDPALIVLAASGLALLTPQTSGPEARTRS